MRFIVSTAIHALVVLVVMTLARVPEPPAAPAAPLPFPRVMLGVAPAMAGVMPRAPGSVKHGSPRDAPRPPMRAEPRSEPVAQATASTPSAGADRAPGTDGSAATQGAGGETGTAQAGQGSSFGGGEVGGVMTYTALSRPPERIEGESVPSVSLAVASTLRGTKGLILVRIWVASDGAVERAEVVRSSLPALDALVVRHVQSWRFAPSIVAGRAASVQFLQPFSFSF